MFKKLNFKSLFLSGLTSFCFLLFYGCNVDKLEENKLANNSEVVEKIKGVAALGKLNPFGEVRKLAAPTSGKGGTPRLYKLLVKEGDSIVKGQILAVFDNRPKLEADLSFELANYNILINEIRIQKREINRYQILVDKGAEAAIVLDKMKDDLTI